MKVDIEGPTGQQAPEVLAKGGSRTDQSSHRGQGQVRPGRAQDRITHLLGQPVGVDGQGGHVPDGSGALGRQSIHPDESNMGLIKHGPRDPGVPGQVIPRCDEQ